MLLRVGKGYVMEKIMTWKEMPDFDEPMALDYVGGEIEFLVTILDVFCQELKGKVLLIKEAAYSENLDGVAKAAHSLKGAAANVFALRLKGFLEVLETAARNNEEEVVESLIAILDDEYERFSSRMRLREQR
jgi:HPt (histidine-containing phosphotransfer) domain-containing protein